MSEWAKTMARVIDWSITNGHWPSWPSQRLFCITIPASAAAGAGTSPERDGMTGETVNLQARDQTRYRHRCQGKTT
ncbi:hypothetical protein FRC19_008619 [Serendipita sp. 401]|nr:hypothetical protein FRC19_008619 [Serendipita sp. 401]